MPAAWDGVPELTLREADLDADPHRQFQAWLQQALDAGQAFAHAMALATTRPDGEPSVRTVLLESVDGEGFTFETNLDSPKAHDLAANPRAAATFFWPTLMRQVRLSGRVAPLGRAEVAQHFAAMPREIQAMLRACRQSAVIPDRAALERSVAEALASGEQDLPEHWGGYRLRIDWIEFFQARANWLQDRLRYTRERDSATWRIERLVP